jgi:hypothetical protein
MKMNGYAAMDMPWAYCAFPATRPMVTSIHGKAKLHKLLSAQAEELPQHDQPSVALPGPGAEECLDVVHTRQSPVAFTPGPVRQHPEFPHDRQGHLDGVIRTGRVPARRARPWRAASRQRTRTRPRLLRRD